MRLIRYFVIFQVLIAVYAIIKSITIPADKMITIPSFVFYMLVAWASFGTIYIIKILDEGGFKFGNKYNKSREDVVKLLIEISDKIMKKGVYNKSSVEFVKIATEYSLMSMKSDVDLDHFLMEKIENLGNIMKKEDKDFPSRDGRRTIALYEKFPDSLKDLKSAAKNRERNYESAKESRDGLMKALDDTARELEKKDGSPQKNEKK